VNVILNLASQADRRLAAIATTNGGALFYGFGNFCALAAMPDLASMARINALKGRPATQAGSVTTDPWRASRVFDWHGTDRARIEAVMEDFMAVGPIGFRGPASEFVPDHLTVMDGDIRTAQLISPGLRCPSNMLVGEILNRSGGTCSSSHPRTRRATCPSRSRPRTARCARSATSSAITPRRC
jgi:hypothetical protein